MNVDPLLAIVSDLSIFTTTEQLQERLSQCRAACAQFNRQSASSSKADREKAKMLLAAIARIENKIVAIEFSARREAQRALAAAAAIPQERFPPTRAKAQP